MTRLAYDIDLTDAQWETLKPLIPEAKSGGRPRTLDRQEVLNAIFYLLANGIKWRAMPHDLPKWQSVYTYFRDWEADGTWERLNSGLRTQVRLAAGRNAQPSAGSVDSQSVKTASGGEDIGFDGGKKRMQSRCRRRRVVRRFPQRALHQAVKGRKRTILVDTMGLLLGVCVHSARRSDHAGMILLAAFWAWLWQCLQVIWIDSTFAGKEFVAKIEQQFGWKLEHVDRVEFEKSGISVIARRPSYADRLNTKCGFYGTLMRKLEGQPPKLPSH